MPMNTLHTTIISTTGNITGETFLGYLLNVLVSISNFRIDFNGLVLCPMPVIGFSSHFKTANTHHVLMYECRPGTTKRCAPITSIPEHFASSSLTKSLSSSFIHGFTGRWMMSNGWFVEVGHAVSLTHPFSG